MSGGALHKLGTPILLLVCCLFAISSASERLERRFGLPLLFHLRNVVAPSVPPTDLSVLTPFKRLSSTRAWDLRDVERELDGLRPDRLRDWSLLELESELHGLDLRPVRLPDWSRVWHIDAIDRLTRLGVSVLAIDIFFRDPHPDGDEGLARALRSVPSTLLVQDTRESRDALRTRVLENPRPPLAAAVTRLAPWLVPAMPVRNDFYTPYVHLRRPADDTRCARLREPVPTAQRRVGAVPGAAPKTTVPAGTPVHDLVSVPILPLVAVELWSTRSARARSPFVIPSEPSRPDAMSACGPTARADGRDVPSDASAPLLFNLYGPPGTIETRDYDELRELERAVESGERDNPLRGGTVFLGGAFDTLSAQREDGYVTVFASNERPMSGVELAATVFANLRDGRALSPQVNPRTTLLSTLAVLLPLVLLSRPTRTRRSLLIAALSAAALSAYVFHAFSSAHLWLPLITPLLALGGALALFVIADLRASNRLEERARDELGTFVSALILEQLDSGRPCLLERATCLVSDMREFTASGERLTTEALHARNERYFEVLFEQVAAHGADVVKTYGDSMTAVWRGAGTAQRERALQAGRDILTRLERPSREEAMPATHLGFGCGPIVVGYVGTERRRSVELTGTAIYQAARLEQLNKVLGTKMLASAELVAGVEGFRLRDVGRHALRGLKTPVSVVAIEATDFAESECAAS